MLIPFLQFQHQPCLGEIDGLTFCIAVKENPIINLKQRREGIYRSAY